MPELMRSILHWTAGNLTYLVGLAFAGSLVSLTFSIRQVIRQKQRKTNQLVHPVPLGVAPPQQAPDAAQIPATVAKATVDAIRQRPIGLVTVFDQSYSPGIDGESVLDAILRHPTGVVTILSQSHNVVIDDVSLAALSGLDIEALTRPVAATENRNQLAHQPSSQTSGQERRGQKIGPGNKQDDVTGALLGGKRSLATVAGN